MMTRARFRSIGRWGTLAGLLAVAGWVVLRPPCLGVSDNLDYWRVMRPAGIAHLAPVERPGEFVECHFSTSRADLSTGGSSPALVAWTAKHLGWLFGAAPHRMDLRQTGTVYLVLIGLLMVAARSWRVSPLLAGAWLYVLLDPGYLLFVNSFYADPALLVALLGLVCWFVQDDESSGSSVAGSHRRWSAPRWIALLVLVLLGGASKMQYVLLPVIATIASVPLARRRKTGDVPSRRFLRGSLPGFAALLLVAALVPVYFFLGSGPRFLQVNNYHAVYAGLLQVTEAPDRVLRSLGVPREQWELPRRDVWSARLPADHPVHASLESLSRWRLLGLYAAEPAAMLRVAERIGATLARTDSHRRGTYPRSAGRRRGAQYRPPWAFSRLHGVLFSASPAVPWLVLGSALAWVVVSALRGRWSRETSCALFLVVFAVSQFAVVVLGDGFVAFEQHLLGARFALDLLLVLVAWVGLRRLLGWLALSGRRRSGPPASTET